MNTKSKYILLDIDGVLTSNAYTGQCRREGRQANLFGLDWFDPACKEALTEIVKATGAKVVISSAGRELGLEKLQTVWKANAMPGKVVGTTPIWILTKKEAIEHWIRIHPLGQFVILDDVDYGYDRFVRTDPETGLTSADALIAIALLNV